MLPKVINVKDAYERSLCNKKTFLRILHHLLIQGKKFEISTLSLPPTVLAFQKGIYAKHGNFVGAGEAMHDSPAFGETFLTVGLGCGVKVVEGSTQGAGPSHMNHSDAHLIEPPTRMVSRPSRYRTGQPTFSPNFFDFL